MEYPATAAVYTGKYFEGYDEKSNFHRTTKLGTLILFKRTYSAIYQLESKFYYYNT